MTDLRTAAQQALEACEQRLPLVGQAAIIDELNNLRAALAQPDPQDAELSAALGWPGGISEPVLDRKTLLQQVAALRAALAEPTVKESLQVPAEVAAALTTTDIAWLETRRLTKLWQELGQMRWAGADEGWDRAIEAIRNRLDKECRAVLDWKAKADQSQATAVQLLRKMQGLKDD